MVLRTGAAATYLTLGEQLPVPQVGPQLALAMAYAAANSGRLDRVPNWLNICGANITTDTVVRGWRNPPAAAVMMRAVIGTADADSAHAETTDADSAHAETTDADSAHAELLCRQAVALETDAGPGHQIALAALGSALARDGRSRRLLTSCGSRGTAAIAPRRPSCWCWPGADDRQPAGNRRRVRRRPVAGPAQRPGCLRDSHGGGAAPLRMAVGALGGGALIAAVWLGTALAGTVIGLVVAGTVPFAALAGSAIVPVLPAVVAAAVPAPVVLQGMRVRAAHGGERQ